MNDKKLRALLTAVQCGSFGKATAQLGYTQSAMTHMVNRLEAELGCTLLVRGPGQAAREYPADRLLCQHRPGPAAEAAAQVPQDPPGDPGGCAGAGL